MNKQFPLVELRNAAVPVERSETPVAGKTYRQIGVRLWGQGAYERESIDGIGTKYASLSQVESGDIIVNKIWARNGSVAVVSKELAGCFGSGEFPTFSPIRSMLNPQWFHWITKTKWFWEACDEKSRGTSGKNRIKPELFLSIKIPLPLLEEQQRIVARIESLAAKIEEALGLRKQAVEEAEALLDSTLSQIHKKNENNPTWETGPMPMFVLINPSRKGAFDINRPSEVSFIPMSAVDDVTGRIIRPETKNLDDVIKGYTYFEEGDVIFARITPCMQNGKAALAMGLKNRIGFGSTEFHVLRPKEKILGEWLHHLVRHKEFRDDAATHFKGTAGQQRVPQKFLENKIIPVPQKDEQRRIVTYLDGFQAKVDSLKRLQEETSKELDAMLPSVLDKAFKGEL